MKITFQFTPDELRRINRERQQHLKLTSGGKLVWRVYYFAVMPGMALLAGYLCGDFLVGLLMTVSFWAVNRLITIWDENRMVKRLCTAENLASRLKSYQLELQADSLVLSSSLATYRYSWGYFHSLRESSTYFFLMLGATENLTIPKRAFGNDVTQEAFRKEVTARLQSNMG